ncbi:hypothetical protein [Microbacterium sp.]|uniref:hypothetical protein n=1 Tax=Microbacterium sp. TaxID=51671 RepID=UPI0025EC03DD|nr:hypothetical protein [Microbacterium sp.]MBT9605744.1 hypothetical protein [Microbacterium sp.]
MFGEEAHAVGAEGVQKAKRWLEATTRVDVQWIYPEEAARKKLAFQWHDNSSFVYDMGGVFRGGPLANQTFMAEVKNYSTVGKQGPMYEEYLARCYRARQEIPGFTEQFMWITWHPFSQGSWTKLTTAEAVRDAVIKYAPKALGVDVGEATSAVDDTVCAEVAETLWLLVLSDKHELLMLSDLDRAAVISAQITRAGA